LRRLHHLRIDADAAVGHHGAQRQAFAVGRTLSCTCSASSRVGTSTSARTELLFTCMPSMVQALQQGQGEAGGLAGAGLGGGHDVASGQHGGNRLRLHGGGRLVGQGFEGADDLVDQAEGLESHGMCSKTKRGRSVAGWPGLCEIS
jgi:hypothetical protein